MNRQQDITPMANGPNLTWIASYIWGIADDVLRDVYVRGKYRDVILPMTVLRRLDAVLEPTKQDVLNTRAFLDILDNFEFRNQLKGGPEHSTLSNDGFPSREFDFMLSNPPYGKSWDTDLQRMGGKKDMGDPRFVIEHAGDPQYSLLTSSPPRGARIPSLRRDMVAAPDSGGLTLHGLPPPQWSYARLHVRLTSPPAQRRGCF